MKFRYVAAVLIPFLLILSQVGGQSDAVPGFVALLVCLALVAAGWFLTRAFIKWW